MLEDALLPVAILYGKLPAAPGLPTAAEQIDFDLDTLSTSARSMLLGFFRHLDKTDELDGCLNLKQMQDNIATGWLRAEIRDLMEELRGYALIWSPAGPGSWSTADEYHLTELGIQVAEELNR